MPRAQTWRRGDYEISTDPARLDVGVVHEFLSRSSYWAEGIPLETVRRSIDGSLVFGLFHLAGARRQVGFARVITDSATFAYLCDVFVLPEHRGEGLGGWLTEVVVNHPALQGLRRWLLGTKYSHDLYRRVGFTPLGDPG